MDVFSSKKEEYKYISDKLMTPYTKISLLLIVVSENYIFYLKGATKSFRKIIFVSTTKIGGNSTNILNC